MSIKSIALQSDEQITLDEAATVGVYALNQQAGVANQAAVG